jgi:beta-lactamase superfamily II metal-dependent hydrolase
MAARPEVHQQGGKTMARLQIDMLPVGDSNAFLVEVQTEGDPTVALVGGGRNWEDGDRVLRQLDAYYGGRIDHMILSHIDSEHASGQLHIAETLDKKRLGCAWVQDLSQHGIDVPRAIALARRAADEAKSSVVHAVATHLADSVEGVQRLIDVLKEKGIPVREAFADRTNRIGPFQVLAPTVAFFEECVKFYNNVELLDEMVESGIAFARGSAVTTTGPTYYDEALAQAVDDPQTQKQASLIVLLTYEGDRYLFTGDAGKRAFAAVADKEKLRNLHWLQVPNHGSKHNLTPELLDLFRPALAYISCSGIGLQPHPDLLRALESRGAVVYTTSQSGNVWHRRGDVPARRGFEMQKPR